MLILKTHPYQIFLLFLRLGCTSFGGPIAAIGYFREAFVDHRQWLHESTYTELVALCQLLPGPASSQIALSIGLLRGGYLGAILALLGFALPSTIIMIVFGLTLSDFSDVSQAGWAQGAKIIAVAVVAHAIWKMGKALNPDKTRLFFIIIAAAIALWLPSPFAQVGSILSGGLLGWLFLKKNHAPLPTMHLSIPISRTSAFAALLLFFILLLVTPIAAQLTQQQAFRAFDGFFRAGALVYGGGHVILPLLQSIVVPGGMVSNDLFLAGYGIAQAIPGPLVSFAAYLGTISKIPPNGVLGGILCLLAIYLPSFLLIIGLLPFWGRIRRYSWMHPVMLGLNASVIGLLIAALYNPVWTNAIHNLKDLCFALVALLLLSLLKWPPWLVVLLGVSLGQILL